MERSVPTDESSERLKRAVAAYLRQQIQAPASAVADYLDGLVHDARRLGLGAVLPDLDQMVVASRRLNAFVSELIAQSVSRRDDEDAEALQRRLRHDLRTPLNAIIGYSEMLLEDMAEADDAPLRGDLHKLRESAEHVLGQIDAMVALTTGDDSPPEEVVLVADALRTVRPLGADPARAEARPSRILVVDDNASNRDVLERRLGREGHQVTTVADGSTALVLVSEQPFDLVLLDLIMPGISGFEVLEQLKAGAGTAHVPVIVISALDELDSVVRCIEAGADDYLQKPFDPILLRTRIRSSLERKWLRDAEKQFVADLDREKQKSDALLLNILPPSIAGRMRDGELVIADGVMESSILFCDLVGFTSLSARLTAAETVEFLGRVFTEFDALVADLGVEKIKTIGDAYMAAAGIPDPQPDHALRIARLATRMMRAVEQVAHSTGHALEARIGIHSGPVVAGVIGTRKFAYDVWGDTVNTASRMESHSETGRIHLSETTVRELAGRFHVEPRGSIEVKGKGAMNTYFLGAELGCA
jgi:adenylate cyclase